MLIQRLRRWPNINQTMGRCLIFAGIPSCYVTFAVRVNSILSTIKRDLKQNHSPCVRYCTAAWGGIHIPAPSRFGSLSPPSSPASHQTSDPISTPARPLASQRLANSSERLKLCRFHMDCREISQKL